MKKENLYNNKKLIKNKLLLFIILIILIVDFFSKKLIKENLFFGESKKILFCINFTYIHNTGIAFGIFSYENELQKLIIIIISEIISIILLFLIFYFNKLPKILNIAYAIIIGGIQGNVFDRIINNSVIDFIDFNIKNYHFPIFNFADFTIFIGYILILLNKFNLFNKYKKYK